MATVVYLDQNCLQSGPLTIYKSHRIAFSQCTLQWPYMYIHLFDVSGCRAIMAYSFCVLLTGRGTKTAGGGPEKGRARVSVGAVHER